jgi:hypothetical protein
MEHYTELQSYYDPVNTLQPFIHDFIVDEYKPDLTICTRNDFYYAVKSITPELLQNIVRQGTSPAQLLQVPPFQIFQLCAANQELRRDPVDSAIHAYSKLIRNIILTFPEPINDKIGIVLKVVEFLKTKRTHDNNENYTKMKNSILLLFGQDMLVSLREGGVFYSTPIYSEMKQLILDIFHDQESYIASSKLVKSLIFRFYIANTDARFRQAYSRISPLSKAHFFIHIMDNHRECLDRLDPDMITEIKNELRNQNSELKILLRNYSLYPTARIVANSLETDSPMPQYIPPTPDTLQRPPPPQHPPQDPPLPRRLFNGGSRRKSTLLLKRRKLRSKSKSKSNKNRMQRKKSHRRSRGLK